MLKAPGTEKSKPPRQPLGLEAYEQICRGIITLAYQPGTMLDEKQLMAELQLDVAVKPGSCVK